MITLIIVLGAAAALALSIALIFKWKNQVEVEEEKTQRQKNRQDFFTTWRRDFWSRITRRREARRGSKSRFKN